MPRGDGWFRLHGMTNVARVGSTTLPFDLVDVFGQAPLSGNPLAVVHHADHLDTLAMLALTRWLNLSETTFLLRPTHPEADYRVRIFTPQHELPFAGHPTLGSCHAWLQAGGQPLQNGLIRQECAAGRIPVRPTGDGLAFAAPPLVRHGGVAPEEQQRVADVLGLAPGSWVDMAWTDNGPGWLSVLLPSAQAVRGLSPRLPVPAPDAPPAQLAIGVIGPQDADCGTRFEVRAFITDQHGRLIEDPVTGSLNAALAQWLIGTDRAQAPYAVAQGGCLQRDGRISVTQDGAGQVWIGGRTLTVSQGQVSA